MDDTRILEVESRILEQLVGRLHLALHEGKCDVGH